MAQSDPKGAGDESPFETSDEEWGIPTMGVRPLTLDEQMAIERARRAADKDSAAEGPGLGYSLERKPDPRESDKWFSRMDEMTQTEVRKEWRIQAWLSDAVGVAWADRRRQAYIDAVVIFVLSQTLFDPFRMSFFRILGVLPLALFVGWLWGRFKMGRFQSALAGYPVLLAYQLMGGLAVHGAGGMGDLLTLFYGALAFICLSAMAGLMRESSV